MGKHDYFGWKVLGLLLMILLGLIWTVRSQIKLPEGLSDLQKVLQNQKQQDGNCQAENKLDFKELQDQVAEFFKGKSTGAVEETDSSVFQNVGEAFQKDSTSQEIQSYGGKKIRVVLENDCQGGYYHQKVELTAKVPCMREDTGEQLIAAGEQIILSEESQLLETGTLRLTAGEHNKIQVMSLNRVQGNPAYEGVLEIRKTEQGLLLINEVDIETYLRYVVPSEMPASYQMEALKAQAVCARTYAYKALEEHRMEKYFGDVDDTVSFQVYNNIANQERTDLAVAETSGKVITFQGQLIRAYFFSTSCGHTSTDEVWNGETMEPYLKSTYLLDGKQISLESEESFSAFIREKVPSYDSEETWYRWQISFPAEELQRRFADLDAEAGTLLGIQVKDRSSGGAIKELELQGSVTNVTMTDEYFIRKWFSPGDLPIQRAGRSVSGEMSILPSAYFICTAQEEAGTIVSWNIQGGGYGHGVGMSQNAANQMAEEGKSWEEILYFFYQNIEITD